MPYQNIKTDISVPEDKFPAENHSGEQLKNPTVETPAPVLEKIAPIPEGQFEVSEKVKTAPTEGENFLEEAIGSLRSKLKTQKKKPFQIPTVKDEITIQVEKIMEEGLKDAYQELDAIQKQEFKIKGEETAWKIRDLMRSTHVQVKKIFRLLLEWLKMLPGINRFFLEQEAKIKTDKIITLKEINREK